MIFSWLRFGIIVCFGINLVGCFLVDKNPPTQREQQCLGLKNQLIFNNADAMADTATTKNSTPTITAKTMKQYNEMKCSDFETNKDLSNNQTQSKQ
mgnify:CR=1 FL=1